MKFLIKLCLTVVLIWFIFSKIDIDKFTQTLKEINLFWFFLAFIAFNISKIISSFRLNFYFRDLALKLSETVNLMLYYLGMFYNLFLPGGIGGDGYKIYILNKKHKTRVKDLIMATLLDRISGVVALGFFAGILFCFSSFISIHKSLLFLSIFCTIAIFPVFIYLHKKFFAKFNNSLKNTTYLALIVQLFQLICSYFLILSIGETGMIDFLTVFLISSVVAVVPLTVGGIGAREVTFFYAFELISKEPNSGIVFSILFFMITAFSSLIGILFLKQKV